MTDHLGRSDSSRSFKSRLAAADKTPCPANPRQRHDWIADRDQFYCAHCGRVVVPDE